jgi:hypothetical protein
MTPQAVILLAGILFLILAIVGGGLAVKEIQMQEIATWVRCATAILGLIFITVSVWGPLKPPPSLVNGSSSHQEYACKHPKDLPAVAERNHSESEIRNILTSEGFLNIVTEHVFVPGAPQGVVVGQAPSPGRILCPKDIVTIKITR